MKKILWNNKTIERKIKKEKQTYYHPGELLSTKLSSW
jgi:hypothetical protein